MNEAGPAEPGTPRVARPQKIAALTGLRFVAAAMIVLHHSRGVVWLRKDFLSGVSLQQGVSFFFVLSGFILAHVYPRLPDAAAIARFFCARVARIWPAHVFTFLLVAFLPLPRLAEDAGSAGPAVIALANVAMLHAWVPLTAWFFSFNSVSWSISTEFFFYLAFPFLIASFHRTWWWKAALGVLLVILLMLACTVLAIPTFAAASPFAVNRAGLIYIHPLSRLAEFILGMLTAQVWNRDGFWRKGSSTSATSVEAACLLLCAGAVVLFSAKKVLAQTVGEVPASYLQHAGAAPAFALLILVFASQRGWLSRLFGSPLFVLLGEASFSVYLLHQILLRALVESRKLWSALPEGLVYAGFWLVLLAASCAIWRWFECPARRLLLRMVPRPSS